MVDCIEAAHQLATLLRQASVRFEDDLPRVAGIAEAAADGIDAELLAGERDEAGPSAIIERAMEAAAEAGLREYVAEDAIYLLPPRREGTLQHEPQDS